jgi:hypothetical protein
LEELAAAFPHSSEYRGQSALVCIGRNRLSAMPPWRNPALPKCGTGIAFPSLL